MARYIDADKLIADGWVLERHGTSNKLLQVMSIADVPIADVVEVVRCKDCEYFREYSDAHKRAVERADGDCFLKQTHSCDRQFIACRYNDFCSYGVRK